jgi:ATP-dependent Clp protease adaptor protein ClpS
MSVKNNEDTLIKRLEKIATPPSMYKVILLNDDYTPMEFVVEILQEYFNKDCDSASSLMMKGHKEGKVICGVFSQDIAFTKVKLIKEYAQKEGHPLQCKMEEV